MNLAFPAPRMSDAEKRRLLDVPSKNTNNPRKEVRAKDSVTLKDAIVNTYIGDRGGVCRACKLFINCSKIPRVAGKLLSKPRAQEHKTYETIAKMSIIRML